MCCDRLLTFLHPSLPPLGAFATGLYIIASISLIAQAEEPPAQEVGVSLAIRQVTVCPLAGGCVEVLVSLRNNTELPVILDEERGEALRSFRIEAEYASGGKVPSTAFANRVLPKNVAYSGARMFVRLSPGECRHYVLRLSRAVDFSWPSRYVIRIEKEGIRDTAGRGLSATGQIELEIRQQHGPLSVEVDTDKREYARGEPVACRLRLANVSPHDIQLVLGYPGRLGLTFGRGVGPSALPLADGPGELLTIAAGRQYTAVFALNRYIALPEGLHTVPYVGWYWDVLGDARVLVEGQLQFEVSGRKVDGDTVRRLCAGLEELGAKDLRERVELLLWADHEVLIPFLARAARLLPGVASEVVRALGKFIGAETAREALFEVALGGDEAAVRATYAICTKSQIEVPDSILERNLSSSESGRRQATLEYIRANRTRRHVERVRSLTRDPQETIRTLARDTLRELGD
jgi:hypothetical protein